MEKLIINKGFLTKYDTFTLVFENCDVYDLPVKDVLDIYCIVEKSSNRDNKFHTNDGFIKISASASQSIKCSGLRDQQLLNTEWDHRLKERLNMCDGCADITSFEFKDKQNKKMCVSVPYDSLESVLSGFEIELSNCPSLEVDDDGNMIIAFGKSSKMPTRKDNNYAELILGWENAYGINAPSELKIKVGWIKSFGVDNENFSVIFESVTKLRKKKQEEFVFMGCKNVNVDTIYPQNGDCTMFASKLADGRIYVGFEGLGIEFYCDSILEYNYYRNVLEENEKAN